MKKAKPTHHPIAAASAAIISTRSTTLHTTDKRSTQTGHSAIAYSAYAANEFFLRSRSETAKMAAQPPRRGPACSSLSCGVCRATRAQSHSYPHSRFRFIGSSPDGGYRRGEFYCGWVAKLGGAPISPSQLAKTRLGPVQGSRFETGTVLTN